MPEASEVDEGRSDDELVDAACRGETPAFECLVLRHRAAVGRVVARFFGDPADIDDVSQEAFVRAYNGLSRKNPDSPFRFWLLRVAANCALDLLRQRTRRATRPVGKLDADEADWIERHMAADSVEKHRQLERAREARAILEKVSTQIAPKDRLVLYLMVVEEMSVDEVARMMGWSKSLVKVRAFRARRSLRKSILKLMPEGWSGGRHG